MGWRVMVMLALASCIESSSVQCDGYVCPTGNVCDTANGGCVAPEQLTTCNGLADGVDCPIAGAPTGSCRNGVCVKSRCGDGLIRGSERCDGQALDGQNCSTLGYYNAGAVTCTDDCVFDTSQCGGGKCGDHVVQPDHEFCEDGVAPAELSCLDFGFDLGQLGCASTCQPEFASCEHFGFFPIVTGSTGTLRSVWGTSSEDVYVANDSALRHFDGKLWTTIDLGVSFTAYDVSGTSASDIWVVGTGATIVHFDGTTWTPTTLPFTTDYYFLAVRALAANDVYVVGGTDDPTGPNYGVIAHWNGATWSTLEVDTYTADVWASGPNDVYVAGDGGTVYHWGGSQWTPITVGVGEHLAIGGTGPTDIWIGGVALFHYTGTWTQYPLPQGTIVTSIESSGTRVLVSSTIGVLVFDSDLEARIPTTDYAAMWAASPNDVWAVSASGMRRFTGRAWLDDGNTLGDTRAVAAASATYAVVSDLASPPNVQTWNGATWTTLPQCPITTIQGLWVAAPDDVFAVGSGPSNTGTSHYVADTVGGTPYWHAMAGTRSSLLAVWGRNANDVYAVGVNGLIVHWDGSAWVQMTSSSTTTFRGVWGSATDVFAVGFDTVDHFDGVSWTPMTLPPGDRSLLAVWGTASDNVYVGSAGEVLHWNGTTWTIQPSNVDTLLRSLGGNGPNDIWGVGSLGGMAHFDGTTWSPVRIPTLQTLGAIAVTPTRLFIAGTEGTQLLLLP